ncbi:MAG: TIGR01459 family HAD-type hydrolase [Rickettsiales bacterium]|nr:TIGR01459 family HAD-type hydrolase [Rickettsiales bacterium]
MQYINNLNEISSNYQYYIFDVWGVVHDGQSAYEGSIKTIKDLRSQNKKICFLSNAPRRAFKVENVLQKFGVTPDLYDFVMSSGEATYLHLQDNQNNNYQKYGQKYFYIGPQKDIDLLDGLNYHITNNANEASFALTTGFDGDNSTIEEKLPQINEAIQNNLPLICVNPDVIVVRQNGTEMLCAGVIAKEYSKLGGKVQYFGKPYEEVYKTTCKLFNQDINKTDILAIGDGLETDIKGANNFGINNLLLTGGILSNKIDNNLDSSQLMTKLKEICEGYQTYSSYITKFL